MVCRQPWHGLPGAYEAAEASPEGVLGRGPPSSESAQDGARLCPSQRRTGPAFIRVSTGRDPPLSESAQDGARLYPSRPGGSPVASGPAPRPRPALTAPVRRSGRHIGAAPPTHTRVPGNGPSGGQGHGCQIQCNQRKFSENSAQIQRKFSENSAKIQRKFSASVRVGPRVRDPSLPCGPIGRGRPPPAKDKGLG